MFNERNERNEYKYTNKIIRAEKIFFIGFGFDKQNLKALGIPNELKKLFQGKNIYLLNFMGTNKKLESEFNQLRNKQEQTFVTISNADSIINAYVNEFRDYLF